MRKIYLILLAVLGMTVTSCLMEEKELFDKTPAERMEAYLQEYRSLLASAEEGWLLQYFPEENQSYGGYAYVLKFSADSVTAYFQLDDDIATPVSSLYKMTPDDGPVITFDTYNENIHFFATPDVNNYEAYHGDYEFRIVGKNPDETEVYMKGKRTNNNYTLVKFSGNPVEYLDKINEIEDAMSAPAYEMVMNSDTTACSISGNVFEFQYNVYTPEDTTAVTGTASFCYTPEGADFYVPVEINGTEYSKLVFDAENGTLATEDGKITINTVYPPLNQQFVDGDWMINLDGCSAQAAAYFNRGFESVEAYGYPFNIAFIGSAYYGTFGLNVNFGGYAGVLNLDYELIGEDQITLVFAFTGGGNGVTFHNWGLAYALYPLGYNAPKTFTLTADNPKIPAEIILTDNNDPNNVISLLY